MPRHPNNKVYEWNPRVLNYLINKSGINPKHIAEQIGLSYATLRHYMNGTAEPGIDSIVHMANAFAIPIDILLVRCGDGPLPSMFENYEDYFYLMNRTRYETPLLKSCNVRSLRIKPGYESPWPYNLLDDIFNEPFDHILLPDQEAALMKILDTSLTEREQKAIELYYFEGLTLEETGKNFHFQRERARQIIAKAIRKLRHPGLKRMILFGEEGKIEYENACRELNERRRQLDNRESELNHQAQQIEKLLAEHNNEIIHKEEIEEKLKFDEYDEYDEVKIHEQYCSDKFYDMDFSVRTFNCLLRSNVRTVRDLKDCIRSGDIFRIRNFGKKSYEEVLEKILKYDGEDMSQYEWQHNPVKGYIYFDKEKEKRENAS